MTARAHDPLPGEPPREYAHFLGFATRAVSVDAYALERRLDIQQTHAWARRWDWQARRADVIAERERAAALLAIEADDARDRAALSAVRATADAMAVVELRAATWLAQRGAGLDDRTVLGIAREHRQRQRDSGHLKPVEVQPSGAEVDLSGATADELRVIIEAKFRSGDR